MRILLFILIFSHLAWSQDLVLNNFVQELSSRQSQVEEFRYIKKIATKLGIKHVYMFGGTAAAWGHYVRWDMQRELGVKKLQSERFDYDYTNIFRANQDFDVVIDGTVEQATALEKAVQEQFNYFSGTRPTWEVRLLNEQRLDKDPILGSDFQNQHTDSHSTGLIEMMDCEGFDCVKDVRDMNNPKSAFLMDMFEAKLHYYFSDKHTQTSRYLSGKNPPILSVIRYYTKAVQYELEQRPEDIEVLEKMIREFDPSESSKWDGYVTRWLEKNAKKLIVNAIDMEFAQNLIESNGLKEKLIQLGNPSAAESMAWWLNKEALKSFPLGQGDGKTAAELLEANEAGEIIVAHETNSFPAFESITKSHDGGANVLISRVNASGETAAYGDGHYTQIGRYGARGTGLTIRYKLNPRARENTDFIRHGSFIIVKNKKALEVIYESMNLGAVEYFELLATGFSFDFADRGVREKFKRRILRKLQRLDSKELEEIERVVINNPQNENIIREWNELLESYELIAKDINIELENGVRVKSDKGRVFITIPKKGIEEELVEKGNKFLRRKGLIRYITRKVGFGLYTAGYLSSFIYLLSKGYISELPYGLLTIPSYMVGGIIWAIMGIRALGDRKTFQGEGGTKNLVSFQEKSMRKSLRHVYENKRDLRKLKFSPENTHNGSDLPKIKGYHLGFDIKSEDFISRIHYSVAGDEIQLEISPSKSWAYKLQGYKNDLKKILKKLGCSEVYLP